MLTSRGYISWIAAIPTALLATTMGASSAHAQTADVPLALKLSAECMYKVLQATPGVSDAKLGYMTSDGWTYPYLEYRAAEVNSWVQPTRFVAEKAYNGTYSFLGILPGQVSPEIGHIDIHVTEVVVKKWKTQCKVSASVLTV